MNLNVISYPWVEKLALQIILSWSEIWCFLCRIRAVVAQAFTALGLLIRGLGFKPQHCTFTAFTFTYPE